MLRVGAGLAVVNNRPDQPLDRSVLTGDVPIYLHREIPPEFWRVC